MWPKEMAFLLVQMFHSGHGAGLWGTRLSLVREAGREWLFRNSMPRCDPGPRKLLGGGHVMWRAGRKGERLRKNYEVMKRTPRPLIGDQVTTYLLRIRRTFQGKERGRAAVCCTPHCLHKVWPPLLMSCEAPGLKHTPAASPSSRCQEAAC